MATKRIDRTRQARDAKLAEQARQERQAEMAQAMGLRAKGKGKAPAPPPAAINLALQNAAKPKLNLGELKQGAVLAEIKCSPGISGLKKFKAAGNKVIARNRFIQLAAAKKERRLKQNQLAREQVTAVTARERLAKSGILVGTAVTKRGGVKMVVPGGAVGRNQGAMLAELQKHPKLYDPKVHDQQLIKQLSKTSKGKGRVTGNSRNKGGGADKGKGKGGAPAGKGKAAPPPTMTFNLVPESGAKLDLGSLKQGALLAEIKRSDGPRRAEKHLGALRQGALLAEIKRSKAPREAVKHLRALKQGALLAQIRRAPRAQAHTEGYANGSEPSGDMQAELRTILMVLVAMGAEVIFMHPYVFNYFISDYPY